MPSSYYNQLKPEAAVNADFANLLIGKTLQTLHRLCRGDSDIYAKLTDAYNASVIIKSDKLQKIVDTALEKGLVTGYIQIDRYYTQSFSLKEQSQAVIDGFKQVDPSTTVEHYDFWTDVPFFNYLNSESL